MKRAISYFTVAMVLLSIPAIVNSAGQEEHFTIGLKIFNIPAFQSMMVDHEVEEGVCRGAVVGGNVTQSFPDGLVVLRTTRTDDTLELMQVIKEKITSHPISCPDFTNVGSFSKDEIVIDPSKITQASFELHNKMARGGIATGEYWLLVTPITVNDHEAVLEFKLWVKDYYSRVIREDGSIGEKELFSRQIEMEADQTLLVGFRAPSGNERFKGSVYWLAFSQIR